MSNNDTFDKLSKFLIVVAVIILLFSFFTPYLFTRNGSIDFTNTGPVGDTIGGIMNPFIGIVSIIVMFLAFYMQFNANKIVQSQFERNQFENLFFEMLKTHKENSNNISISHKESLEGNGFGDQQAKIEWLETRKKGFELLVDKLNQKYDEIKSKNPAKDKFENFTSAYINVWEDSFGHYFRHLFLMVKFTVSKSEKSMSYEEKRNYLRILRASLTTYEQVFLYYNWLSKYGKQWEDNKNHFFTDFRMIHNVNDAIHTDFTVNTIEPFCELINSKKFQKENSNNEDFLFEHYGN
jgi:hypothetical protein